jgi:cellulose 1,4-beta-cellobiosidase
MTVHSCTTQGPHRCDGIECGDNAKGQRFDGVCDKNGCDFNPYRVGAHDFYGPGPQFKLDSTKPMTVVTQFITTDGTDTGDLKEMRRFYVQDNKTVENPQPIYSANPDDKAISDQFCAVQMTNFSDRLDVFKAKGGIAGMGKAIGRGMSLVISLWDDHEVGMIWLDATDPFTPDPSGPGGYPWGALRGTCNQTSGNYSIVEKLHGDSYGLFSDFRYGEIGTTLGPAGPAPPAPPPACPGGSLATCIAQCPTSPPAAYQKCLNDCIANCGHMEEALEQTVVYPGEGYGVPTKA